MWCNILLLFIFGNIILQTNAVIMCTNQKTAARGLALNLLKGSGSSDCYCSIILNDVDVFGDNVQSKITFEAVHFAGCKYKLVISYNKTYPMLSCNNNNTLYYNINKTDRIQLYLELTSTSEDDTEFEVKITSSDNNRQGPVIRLECLSPNTTDTTAIPSSNRTNKMKTSPPTTFTMKSTEKITTSDMPNSLTSDSNEPTTTSTNAPITNTTITSGSIFESVSIFESTTHQPTTSNLTNSNEKMEVGKHDADLHDDVVTAGIIGGVIGCVIGGVIVGLLIFTIKRIVQHRKKKSTSEMYSSPLSHHQPESHYTDLQLS